MHFHWSPFKPVNKQMFHTKQRKGKQRNAIILSARNLKMFLLPSFLESIESD